MRLENSKEKQTTYINMENFIEQTHLEPSDFIAYGGCNL
jgi:hypothetical protein